MCRFSLRLTSFSRILLLFLFSGKDGGEVGLLPHQLPHKSARIGESFQGDTLLCREQRDGTNHTEERSGNCTNNISLIRLCTNTEQCLSCVGAIIDLISDMKVIFFNKW